MTLLIFLALLSILILVHEFGHFMAAKLQGVTVEKFSLGFGLKLFSKKYKGTEYMLCAIPFGGYVKLAGDNPEEVKGRPDEYLTKPVGARLQIIIWGPLLNYFLGLLCFWFIFAAGSPRLITKVGEVVKGYGAEEVGIKVNDVITSIDGTKVAYWEDIQKVIRSKKGAASVDIAVERDKQQYHFLTPLRSHSMEDLLGKKQSASIIGISPADATVTVKYPLPEALWLSIKRTVDLTLITYEALWRMVTGKLSMKESMTGPLGMYYITSKVASLGIIAIIHFLATISISLCLFNILPLPVLDGGHVLFLAIEKIRGRSLSVKTERVISHIGFSLLMSFVLIVTYNDILRLFGDKLGKFFSK